jgi:hypothetical protein
VCALVHQQLSGPRELVQTECDIDGLPRCERSLFVAAADDLARTDPEA